MSADSKHDGLWLPAESTAVIRRSVLADFLVILVPLGALMIMTGTLLPTDLFPPGASFAPLHVILETFSIVVAMQVFGAGWFGSGAQTSGRMLILACVFLGTGLLDLGHMLSYQDMPVFITPNSVHKGILFWLAARYLVMIGLLMLAFGHGREFDLASGRYPLLVLTLLLVGLLSWVIIAYEQYIPSSFIPGQGLTTYKVVLEYGLVILYGVAAARLFGLYKRDAVPALRTIAQAAVVLALGELCFTLYVSVTGSFNVLGHVFKVLGYGMLYRALFINNVREPYRHLEEANLRLQEVSRAVSEQSGTELFDTLVRELSRQLDMHYVIILEIDRQTPERAIVVAVAGGDRLGLSRGAQYSISNTPCKDVLSSGRCRINARASEKFPQEMLLHDLAIESYLGIALHNASGERIGVLAAFDEKAIGETLPAEELLQIFATRVSGELERMHMIENLRDSERRMSSILMNIQDAVFRTDERQQLIWVTPAAEEITGYGPEELIGMSCTDLCRDPARFEAFMKKLGEGGRSVAGMEMELNRKDGTVCWVSVNAHCYRDDKGRILGVEGSMRDIGPLKQAEFDLIQLNQELEAKVEERTQQLREINQELEAFSYSVSHDLRAPLRHVRGFAEILSEHYRDKLDGEGLQHIQRIERGVARMSQLIEDLLALSQITRHEIHCRELNLSMMVNDILREKAEQEPERRLEAEVEDKVFANADPKLVRIALENLLDNAWKFTRKTAHARIEFGVREEAGRRLFYVKDNGAGFDMKYVERLFTPFQRLHSAQEYEGTGIGLATVARIVRRHGGEIHAESAPGEGACFLFSL